MEALVKHKDSNWKWLAKYFNIFKHIPQTNLQMQVTT